MTTREQSNVSHRTGKTITAYFAAALIMVALPYSLEAGTVKVLTHFNNTAGSQPRGGMVLGIGGALYGTTYEGGAYNVGVVFRLKPPVPPKTAWSRSTLWTFKGTPNGANPEGGLLLGEIGELYGTTLYGGSDYQWGGSVFKLSPPLPGKTAWSYKELFNFAGDNGKYGSKPQAGLVRGIDGSLFGTNDVLMYRLTPNPLGQTDNWAPSVMFRPPDGSAGYLPFSQLTKGVLGELYGTAEMGGNYGYGVVYKLTPPIIGETWTQTILHSFNASSDPQGGYYPTGGVTLGPDGSLYGVTMTGGDYGQGALYRLTPPPVGSTTWEKTILTHFGSATNPGTSPRGPLVFGPDLALYGVTNRGGTENGGTVFRLEPPNSCTTSWTIKVLTNLTPKTGILPWSGVIVDRNGVVFGTTTSGGNYGKGTVFQIVP